ncbi:MAG: butyrate kinase [Firmicutes bacterium]|nr:butyrate kinase [Bacillota bacterium]
MERLLVINPGSTSTKLAIYDGRELHASITINHSAADLAQFPDIVDQIDFRTEALLNWLSEIEVSLGSITAVVCRGGLLKPIPSGVYQVNEDMVADLRSGRYGKHASNLAGLIGFGIGQRLNIPCYIADPVVVDELQPVARVSGHPKISRISIFHALNHKATARRAAEQLGKPYAALKLIVVHMGGGISIGAHRYGHVIDVNNALNGEGPLSPERTGSLPATALVNYYFDEMASPHELMRRFVGRGGLVNHLGTNDLREVQKRMEAGDHQAKVVFRAMALQISKEIGRASAVLHDHVDAVVLTGGMAYSKALTDLIAEYVQFIAQVIVLPGENELEALAHAAIRVLRGIEKPRIYQR